jgi:1-acyl-sn-glycerol-3-phosphate acyltransferase
MIVEYPIDEQNHNTSQSISEQRRVAPDAVLYQLGRSVVALCVRLMFQTDVVWHAPLPQGPKIIAVNHPTSVDPFLVMALIPEPISFFTSGTLFKIPILRRYLHLAGYIPVRHGNGQATLEQARRRLEAGRTVGIFPEGALSPLDGGAHRPRTGAARLALSTGVPVVPVGVYPQRERIRFIEHQVADTVEVGRWYPGGPYAMTVGTPMRFEGDAADRTAVRSVSERIIQRIVHLTQQSAQRMRSPHAVEPAHDTDPVDVAFPRHSRSPLR